MVRQCLLLAAALLLLLPGCGNRGDGNPTDVDSRTPSNVEVRQTAPSPQEKTNPRETADRLAGLARKVPEVKAANCVVFGNLAIVGIDVDGKLDRSRVGTIKYAVAEALRQDPHGVRAVVTADPDLAARIREIAEDVRRGQPVSGFANELADIVGRIMPQLPRDTAPRGQSE